VPAEFNKDHTDVLGVVQAESGHATRAMLCRRLEWAAARADKVLDLLMELGIAWVDPLNEDGDDYWFPSFVNKESG